MALTKKTDKAGRQGTPICLRNGTYQRCGFPRVRCGDQRGLSSLRILSGYNFRTLLMNAFQDLYSFEPRFETVGKRLESAGTKGSRTITGTTQKTTGRSRIASL